MKHLLLILLCLLATSAMGADLRSAGIKGATTSTPCPGCVGEVKTQARQSASALALSTTVASDLTATPLTLTQGTWLIVAAAYCNLSSTMTVGTLGLSTTANTQPGLVVPDANGQWQTTTLPGTASGVAQSLSIPSYVLTTSGVTLHLVITATFTGSNSASGYVTAVRIY